jgi:hypothetical protein
MKPSSTLGILTALLLSACSSSTPAPTPGGDGGGAQGDGGQGGQDSGGASDGGSDSGAPSDDGAAPNDAGGATDASDSGCNSVDNSAATAVIEEYIASAPPVPQGGTIVPGTYLLSAAVQYTGADGGQTGPTGVTYQFTDVTTATTFDYVEAITGGTNPGTYRFSGTYTTADAGVTITFQCGATGVSSYDEFDSNGTKMTFYSNSGPTTSALTFTKQ